MKLLKELIIDISRVGDYMKFSLKESIINISLILLCLITLFGCIYLYNNRETKIENVSLVKDMTDSVGRIKTDKSEKLSKADRPADVLQENGIIKNEDGSLTLIIPEPEGKKEVEEVIIPEPEPEVVIKSNGKVGEVKVTNKIPNETEPLPLYEIGEVIEEIRASVVRVVLLVEVIPSHKVTVIS